MNLRAWLSSKIDLFCLPIGSARHCTLNHENWRGEIGPLWVLHLDVEHTKPKWLLATWMPYGPGRWHFKRGGSQPDGAPRVLGWRPLWLRPSKVS